MAWQHALVIGGAVVNMAGSSVYVWRIFNGSARPNKMTFLMWSIAPLIGGIAAIVRGATWSVVSVFVAGFFPLLIFFVSLCVPRAYWKLTRLDYVCGFFSFLALILWALTKEPNIAIFFAIVSDGTAAVPTLLKAWRHPETESSWGYLGSSFSGLAGVIAAANHSFAQIAFPLYLFLMMGAIGAGSLSGNWIRGRVLK